MTKRALAVKQTRNQPADHVRELRSKLLSGSAWSVVFQVVSKGSLFLVGAVVARAVGVQGFGTFVALQSGLIFLSAVADRGVSLSVEREAAVHSISIHTIQKLATLRLVEGAALGAVAFLILSLFHFGISIPAALGFSAAFSSIYLSYFPNSFLQSQQKFRQSALLQSTGRISYLLVLLGLFAFHRDVASAAIAWAVGEAINAVLQNRLLYVTVTTQIRLDSTHEPPERLRSVLKRALPYWLAMMAFLAYNRADTTICLLFSNRTQAGLYAPASNLQTALMIVPAALTASLAVVASSALKRRVVSQRELLSELRRLTLRAVALSAVVSTIVFAFAPKIILGFVGSKFSRSSALVRILILSLPFNAVQGALVGLLVALGLPRRTTYFYISCFLTSLIMNAILTPSFGAEGAAVAALAREPVGLAVLVLAVRRALSEQIQGLELGDELGDGAVVDD